MTEKQIKFKHKGKPQELTMMVFDNLAEAVKVLGEKQVFSVFNYANEQLTKMRHVGKNPLTPRRRKYTIDISKIEPDKVEALKRLGVLK